MDNNQIIHKYVDIFDSFVIENFIQENDYFIYNAEVFKKLCYENKIRFLLETLKAYYYNNKKYYLEREPITMNQFNTILRQIMKKNEIQYMKKVKYVLSKYQIEYYIYIKKNEGV